MSRKARKLLLTCPIMHDIFCLAWPSHVSAFREDCGTSLRRCRKGDWVGQRRRLRELSQRWLSRCRFLAVILFWPVPFSLRIEARSGES